MNELSQAEVQELVFEFNQWRSQHGTIRVNLNTSEKCVIEFLTYVARGGYYHQSTTIKSLIILLSYTL